MSDLGLQPREVWKQPAQSAAGRGKARWFRKHEQAAALSFFIACLAPFAYVLSAWHSEPSIVILILNQKESRQWRPPIFERFNGFLFDIWTLAS
jgi:hypothetical protein